MAEKEKEEKGKKNTSNNRVLIWVVAVAIVLILLYAFGVIPDFLGITGGGSNLSAVSATCASACSAGNTDGFCAQPLEVKGLTDAQKTALGADASAKTVTATCESLGKAGAIASCSGIICPGAQVPGACSGAAKSCQAISLKGDCVNSKGLVQIGCASKNNLCAGYVTQCRDISSQADCGNQDGCVWS
jgi:hypothetical protein